MRPIEGVDQFIGIECRPSVVPEHGVVHRFAVGVEGDESVLLSGDRDRPDPTDDPGCRQGFAKGVDPESWIGLTRSVDPGHDMGGPSTGDRKPGLGIDDDDLRRLRRTVDSGDDLSVHVLPPNCTPS